MNVLGPCKPLAHDEHPAHSHPAPGQSLPAVGRWGPTSWCQDWPPVSHRKGRAVWHTINKNNIESEHAA